MLEKLGAICEQLYGVFIAPAVKMAGGPSISKQNKDLQIEYSKSILQLFYGDLSRNSVFQGHGPGPYLWPFVDDRSVQMKRRFDVGLNILRHFPKSATLPAFNLPSQPQEDIRITMMKNVPLTPYYREYLSRTRLMHILFYSLRGTKYMSLYTPPNPALEGLSKKKGF